jgi:2-polyprenyl-6-methoxyphenol hydroxylase-like FAD-dependent oxidoreductase
VLTASSPTSSSRSSAWATTVSRADLRGQGIEAVRRRGLLDVVRSNLVDEAGVALVDARGTARATIMANTSGRGRQSLTSEYEIMRGDLVRVLYEATKNPTKNATKKATKNGVEYVFGMSVEGSEQDEHRVVAHFSDGSSDEFDLLVGADGQDRASAAPSSRPVP